MTKNELCGKMLVMKNFAYKNYKYLMILLIAALSLAIACFSFFSFHTASAQSAYTANIYLPSTAMEYYSLNDPIDVYSDDKITAIAQDDQSLLISKGCSFEKLDASFTAIKQIKKFDDNTLLVSDNTIIYKINVETFEKTPLMDNLNENISGNYFDINQNFLVTVFSKKVLVYSIENGNCVRVYDFQNENPLPADGNRPVAINGNNSIFCFSQDGELKVKEATSLNANARIILENSSPSHMIADENFLYYVENKQVNRIAIEDGAYTNLTVDGDQKYQLSNLKNPSGISFKNGNLFITDIDLDAVQEFEIKNDTLVFTGFAIASGKTAYNRIANSVVDVERRGNTLAALDQNKLLIIDTQGAHKYSKDNYKNYFSADLGGDLPDAFALGNDFAMLSYRHSSTEGALKILSLKDGSVYDINIPNDIVEDICYQSGRFYAIGTDNIYSYVYELAENQLTEENLTSATVEFTLLFDDQKFSIDATHITVDVFKNVYLADENGTVKICKKQSEYLSTDVGNISDVIKMETDLGGNLFVLTKNGLYSLNGQTFNPISLTHLQDGDRLKSFTLGFDVNDVYAVYENKEYVTVSDTIGNLALSEIVVPAEYVTTANTAAFENLSLASIADGANKYSVVKNGDKFDYLGLINGTEEYIKICDIVVSDNLTLTALAEKNGVILVNKTEITEYAPQQTAAPQSAFVTTDVNAYYIPIINKGSEYALTDTDKIRLEKGTAISPVCIITIKTEHKDEILNVDFYFASFNDGTTVRSGYIPISFTVEVLSQDFVWENFSIENIKSTTLYSDQALSNQLMQIEAGSIRLLSNKNGVAEIAVQTQNGWITGYINSGAILNAPNTAVRNILIILAVTASVCGSATYFILRKKD